ncbi:hypothetical protein B5M09_013268 [Aphanomyces astaci]|uniref:Uncharacterized protein n=1 Tax=Aphanomyces astaci TaxID=112090 RepID=A0A3R7WE93_APHAT|nr:hypothetical protein B5M09_013268 [Aphanomyces astaci]
MERGKRASTSRPERLAMLEFLRIPDNFNLLTGQATKDIFTIESKLDAICPLQNEMDALLGSAKTFDRRTFWKQVVTKEESRHADYSSVDLGSDDEDANHDPHDAADDPDTETYWARNDADDPGRAPADDNDPGRAPADDDDPGHAQAQPSKSRSKAVLPRKFPTAEKRLTPRKDFSAIYMDVQSQATQLEREKFEYMKANDKDARSTAAALNIRQARASLVEKLVASGVVDPETIRELVSIAFEQD